MAISLIQFAAQTQIPMLRGLIDRISNESAFFKLLKFIPVDGFAYRYNLRENLAGIAFRSPNGTYTGTPSVIIPRQENVAMFGAPVQTDAAIVDMQGDIARANEISGITQNIGLFYDRTVIKGDPVAMPGSFPGLNARCTGLQYLLAGVNGGPLTMPMVDALIDQVVGPATAGKVLIMNKATRRNLTALLRAAAKIDTMAAVSSQTPNYDGVPIVILDEDGDQQPILAENEACGTATNTVSMYCIRVGGDVDGQMVQGLVCTRPMIVHRDVGLLGTYYLDIVEMLGGLITAHPRCVARLGGILIQ